MRTVQAIRGIGIEASMLVDDRQSDAEWVHGRNGRSGRLIAMARSAIGSGVANLQVELEPTVRSVNLLRSSLARQIAETNCDIVNIHWIGGETLSIADIARIDRPVVWTLHDMWTFCGAEHYAPDGLEARWRTGYRPGSRILGSRGTDIDRWTWRRKRRHWRRVQNVICPSRWLADCAAQSRLGADWRIQIVPNPLDTNIFRPWPKSLCREMLGLPADRPLIGFGAESGTSDPRKGWDLLQRALDHLVGNGLDADVVIFGGRADRSDSMGKLKTHSVGRLKDDLSLAALYSAVDLIVVPSRQDNLPQTATEPQSCGCPVVAFDTCGLPDAIEHGVSGYLARPFEPSDLARGISYVLADYDRRRTMGDAARSRAVRLWDMPIVAERYRSCLAEAIATHASF